MLVRLKQIYSLKTKAVVILAGINDSAAIPGAPSSLERSDNLIFDGAIRHKPNNIR